MESQQSQVKNRYVKIKDHSNWYLVLEPQQKVGELSSTMQEKILRSQVAQLHNPVAKPDEIHRIIMAATREVDYERYANTYGTILIREIGSFMPLDKNEITSEIYCTHFPIEQFAPIVICENDQHAEYKWVQYLQNRFPGKDIVTINFFDLRTEDEIKQYFTHAEIITFSTTFSSYNWYRKLSKLTSESSPFAHKQVIGYCHMPQNWLKALCIKSNIEQVDSLY